jgi:methanogenic corrinoid protein MtbC1
MFSGLGQLRRLTVRAASPGRRESRPLASDVETFAEIVLSDDIAAAVAHLEELRADGVAVESLVVDVIEPAATRLGDRWLDDRCDLAALTLSLTWLQQILRGYSAPLYREIGKPTHERRILVAAAPGEQHVFGSVLAAELFYCAGWCVQRELATSIDTLACAAARERLDVVHLSLSCALASSERVAPLARLIGVVRSASRNPGIRILVSGRVFKGNRRLASTVGADGVCAGARDAVARAGRFGDAAAPRASPGGRRAGTSAARAR